MEIGSLQHVYERPGPFVTAYLDTSGDAEDAAKAIELRWRAVRERLQEQGADETALHAIEDHVREHRAQTGQRGQVLIARGDQVVLQDELPEPPTDLPTEDQAHVGPIPHLMPYLRRCMTTVPFVIADVDRAGADLSLVRGPGQVESVRVDGEQHPVHKTRAGDEENHQRFHMAVEERWKRNAEAAAGEIVERASKIGAQAIVLTGEDQQRALVRELVGDQGLVIEPDSRTASAEQLRREVTRRVHESQIADVVEEFRREAGRGERAVEGWQDTVEALRRGQVRTLLWTADDHAGDLHVGSGPTELAADERTLTDSGGEIIGDAPASAAVVRALAGTDADLVITESDTVDLTGGIGAVLRYRAA
ncbi:hypothetical protein QFW96_04175 [Saccharopolyspora sp. TS4A08]|uniref:Peptide chain release factor 1 n=1 Tax=Saccharopolyspora ipomoeae TaxID=3042027 RepID=A0ABT6PIK7_9PSEU|nr:hypothetical protein [Saccharopolyspora sp. TS4A08]MDI2027789.1 hypothetical protein [Saccharopolyspora sp. TS4A08]